MLSLWAKPNKGQSQSDIFCEQARSNLNRSLVEARREHLRYESKNTLKITESRYDPKYCQRGGFVVGKIEDLKNVLQDPKAPREEKQKALSPA